MKLTCLLLLAAMNLPVTNTSGQAQRPLMSFGLVADAQYSRAEPAGTRFYNKSKIKLAEAYDFFRADSVDFIINLGDLIDKDFESFAPMLGIIEASGLKTWHVDGNHDYAVAGNQKRKLPVATRKGYYSFVKGDFRLIFLNGNEVSTYGSGTTHEIKLAEEYLQSLKNAGAINAMEWNGGMGTAQIGWLKKELDEAKLKKQRALIFCHFPVYPENVHNLFNYKEVLQLLESYDNVIAWFNGHNHAGNYGNFHMIHFITLRGMVETESNSFSVVEVYKNKLWIRGFGREKDQILAY